MSYFSKYIIITAISPMLILLLTIVGCGEDDGTSTQATFPNLQAEDKTVEEADDDISITLNVTLDQPFGQSGFVSYSSRDGNAIGGLDYKSVSGSLEFAPGELSKEIEIVIIGDFNKESTESFFIEFTSGINISLQVNQVEITITDADTQVDTNFNQNGYVTPLEYDGYELVWNDEFDGTSLSSDWKHEIGTGNNGWGNNELQYYRKENTAVAEGFLFIEAKQESFGGRQYTSSRMITEGQQSFKYGRIDVRAILPQGQGLWPAIWMLGSNFRSVGWPRCGEIDIMEMIGGDGREKTVHGTIHWDNNGTKSDVGDKYTLSGDSFFNKFHVFTIIWDESNIKWYVDDNLYFTVDITPDALSEFRAPFFFIMNVAVGGNWPGSPNANTQFPQRMIVDYLRVFQER